MTSTTGTSEHPEVEEISALAEGILPSDRSAAIRGHLADCLECAEVRRSLDEVRALLGSMPSPGPMPDGIADRINAALASEAAAALPAPVQGTGVARRAPQQASPGRPEQVQAHHHPPQREEGTTRLPPQRAEPSGVSRETSAASRRPLGSAASGPATAGPGRSRWRGRWARMLIAACGAAILAGGMFALLSHTLKGSGSPAATAEQPAAFSGVALQLRVHQLLVSASPKAGAQAGPGGPMHPDIAGLPLCVLQATHRDEQPLATVRGRYAGHDAYLIVLPHPADPASVDAFVVDASCTASEPLLPGRLLAEATYHRD